MTVRELIERLQQENPDDEVHYSYSSGDYWGTVISREVDSVRLGQVKYSEYHRTYKVVEDECYDENDYDEEGAEDIKGVVILS